MKNVEQILAKRRMTIGFCGLGLLLLLGSGLLRANTSEDILSLAVRNYTSYVIAADANLPSSVYNRDTIQVGASVQFTTTNTVPVSFEYQAAFRLLDSHSNAVQLVTSPGQTNTAFLVNST